ncbi:MAG: hypothetical protein OHK0046_45110 [Anaerolineae bacterium]
MMGVLLAALLFTFPARAQQDVLPANTVSAGQVPGQGSDRLGIAHISFSTEITPAERYHQALALGAGWNRWPLYWNHVETAPGEFNWSEYDRQVRDDLAFGLNINAILIGVPAFFQEDDVMQGLNAPVFEDGTDVPEPGKALNPDNPWVNFVYAAVKRYKPGGELGLSEGITVWEVWNEPDLPAFWQGSIREYARLLKISYLTIKFADPDAQVMVGGLLYPTENNWLAQILNIYARDPMAANHNQFMDIVAIHNYSDPWRSGWLGLYARETLEAYGIERPVWLNETGVAVWDDYPGPVWEPTSVNRATRTQQAWFFIQSAAYAWAYDVEKVFYHQLYDDCGDQPAGTNFTPHQGEQCTTDAPCFGDAFGLYRNTSAALCFSWHPEAGTARPVARAYRLVAEIFGAEPFDNGEQVYLDNRVITLTFERPRTGERLMVMWNRTFDPVTLALEAEGNNAELLSLESQQLIMPDDDGFYQIPLPPAEPDNFANLQPLTDAAIGGMPFILIERPGDSTELTALNLDDALNAVQAAVVAPVAAVPGAVAPGTVGTLPPVRPTVDPAGDRVPPTAQVLALPPVSPSTFTVRWEGQDNSGIDYYLIWVRINGGEWTPWVETPLTSADYTGVSGNTYEFAAWAVDLAGNWSTNTNLQLQAGTRVE